MLGETLGSYRVMALLGQGGMGRVYLAEHALIGRKAAVKVLLKEFSTRPEIVERFFNEARALAKLHHPGLVDVFDYGKHSDGSAYLVMEVLDGESLASRLRREGALAPGTAIEIARQMALAVAAAHKRRIVHRDLKPDNVMLVSDPELASGLRAKILDFGIAKLADGAAGAVRTRTDLVMGTPAYMSPEQCRGAGLVDERADIYSLGCILYEMACGRRPFVVEGSGELIAAHIYERPPRPREVRRGVPAELEGVILRSIEKTVEARYQSMGQMAAALERLQRAYPPPVGSARSQPVIEERVGGRGAGGGGGGGPGLEAATTLGGSAAELTPPDVRRVGSWRRVAAVGAVLMVSGAVGAMVVWGLGRGRGGDGDRAGQGAATAVGAEGARRRTADAGVGMVENGTPPDRAPIVMPLGPAAAGDVPELVPPAPKSLPQPEPRPEPRPVVTAAGPTRLKAPKPSKPPEGDSGAVVKPPTPKSPRKPRPEDLANPFD